MSVQKSFASATYASKESSQENLSIELVQERHSNVCGPIAPVAWNGCRYFVSFIDDCTHFAGVYVFKKKSYVLDCLVEYEAILKSMFGNSR